MSLSISLNGISSNKVISIVSSSVFTIQNISLTTDAHNICLPKFIMIFFILKRQLLLVAISKPRPLSTFRICPVQMTKISKLLCVKFSPVCSEPHFHPVPGEDRGRHLNELGGTAGEIGLLGFSGTVNDVLHPRELFGSLPNINVKSIKPPNSRISRKSPKMTKENKKSKEKKAGV